MTEPLRVLQVEDEASDAELALRELKRAGLNCIGRRVDSEDAFVAELGSFQPDVILSDFSMPRFDGMSALAIAHRSYPDIPFIFVSGNLGEEYAIRALKSGASDYVLKDNLLRLPPTVERALQEARSAQAQRGMEVALRDSEQRFRLAAASGEVWDWTVATGVVNMSPERKRRLGYEAHEIADTVRAWNDLVHPDDREPLRQAFAVHLRSRVPLDIEIRERRRGGDYAWTQIKGMALWDGDGRAHYMAGTVFDITERKTAEIRIRRLNRVYAMLSGINSLIVRAQTRDELFREACRLAVQQGQLRASWIGMVDAVAGIVRPAAWYGLDKEYLRQLPAGLELETSTGSPPSFAARVVASRRGMVSNDLQAETLPSIREAARQRGLQSIAVLPLQVGDTVAGVLTLYAAEVGFFDAEEMKLLSELAGDIAFAMDHIEKAERLHYLAYFDTLTGLANRSLLHERLTQQIEAAQRERHGLAVLAINVDRFKAINDSLGRQTGDQLLQQLAQRCREHVHEGVWFSRVEADHFALVVPELRSAEELARRIEALYPRLFDAAFNAGGAELRISARFGIALFPEDGSDAETLLRNAEAAVKKARGSGERYLFYAQDMTSKIASSLALENKLRQALERNEFVLYYQPKVDARTRRIRGLEALIRWRSPELGLVAPMQFIPLLEETGLIKDVGAWALRQAALDHRRLHETLGLGWSGGEVPRIAVNVSPVQLRKSDFVDTVRAAVALDVQPTGLDLELTESLIMDDIEANIGKLERLRELGLSVAIDDFGTGYSSLRYLAKLPVQTLKIDRSFVITMLEESDTMTLVSTVISLAHSLRLRVVAEGVDAQAQAEVLRELQCDEMQGFLFSRPVPFESILALLQAGGVLQGAGE